MKKTKKGLLVFLSMLLLVSMASCGGTEKEPSASGGTDKRKVVFADPQWDSIRFHNAVVMYMLENAYGIESEEISGSTAITWKSIINGEIDVYTETWTSALPTYSEDIAGGQIIELGANFSDSAQGVYVPAYIINGDAERNIEATAPELRTVKDLKKYKDVFQDPEDKEKGRIYGGIPGWTVTEILEKKYYAYGLDEEFNYFQPGSETGLGSSLVSAYQKGEAWAGYYWEPTWIIGKYDMVRLEDDPYNEDTYNEGLGDFPMIPVMKVMNANSAEEFPEVKELLSKYETSSKLTSEALSYIEENKITEYKDAAKWFLTNHPEILENSLDAEHAKKVADTLK